MDEQLILMGRNISQALKTWNAPQTDANMLKVYFHLITMIGDSGVIHDEVRHLLENDNLIDTEDDNA